MNIRQAPIELTHFHDRSPDHSIDTVLLHFCSDVVAHPDSPYDLKLILNSFEQGGVSAHYFIDREGEIYKAVPCSKVAYHAGVGSVPWDSSRENRLNEYSIGIELLAIGSREDMAPYLDAERYESIGLKFIGFTDSQYTALNILLDRLLERYIKIARNNRGIFGHDQYASGRKTDPGTLFDWNKIKIKKSW